MPTAIDTAYRDFIVDGIAASGKYFPDKATVRAAFHNLVPLKPQDFGAVGDGVADDTASLQNWINSAINGGVIKWATGTYKITSSLVIQSPSNINSIGPTIFTDPSVYINCASLGNQPAIKIWNYDQDPATAAGKTLNYGYLGDLYFTGATPIPVSGSTSANPLQDALNLRGLTGWRFGRMSATSIGGSVVHMPVYTTQGGTNPDPYNVAFCNFDIMSGFYVGGFILNAANGVGEAGNTYAGFNGIGYGLGGIYSAGAGNTYGIVSFDGYGWAIYIYGLSSTTRNIFAGGELDTVEYGIHLGGGAYSTYEKFRFIHRNVGSREPTAACWPKICIQYGGSGSLTNNKIQCEHRINPGVTLSNIGVFHDFRNDPNVAFNTVNIFITDNAGFTTPRTTAIQNISPNAGNSINCDGLKFATSALIDYVYARIPAYTVAVGGFTTSVVPYSVVDTGRASMWDASNFWVLMPYSGEVQIEAQQTLPASIAAGTQVKIGIVVNRGGTITALAAGVAYAPVGGGVFQVSVRLTYSLLAGDKIYVSCALTSGSSAAITGVLNTREENFFTVKYIQ